MSNMDSKQIKLVIGLLVAVVLFVAIRFGYTPIIEKADAVSLENQTLEAELSSLRADEQNKDRISKDLDAAKAELEIIKRKYPALVTPEKSIKFVKDMEVSTGVTVDNISFNEAENIYSSSFVNDQGESILGYVTPLSISYEASYEGLKNVMNYINGYAERMNVREFTAAYNQETGLLTGNIIINRYYVTGLGKQYEPPAINDVKISTNNIFNAVK